MSYVTPEGLHIAGQADLICKQGNDISVLDWKTNKEIKKRSFFNKSKKKNVMMKYPLNNIEDSNYWHYTLQLSLYAYILQKLNPDFNIKSLKLVHIARDGKQTIYDLEYRKNDVERMLKHYAKQLKTRELLDRDKSYL
jgi:ATP-dependent exoDNAse (exonuclease V) beta subunit